MNVDIKNKWNEIIRNRTSFWIMFFLFFALFFLGFFYLFFAKNYEDSNEISHMKNEIDINYIINWFHIDQKKIMKIQDVYTNQNKSQIAYKIIIKDLKYTDVREANIGAWYQGNNLPQNIIDVVDFIEKYRKSTPWFIAKTEILKSDTYLYPWSLSYKKSQIDSVELIVFRPNDNVFYFVSIIN